VFCAVGVEGHTHHQRSGLPFLDEAGDDGETGVAFGGHGLERLRLAQQRIAGGHADTARAVVKGQQGVRGGHGQGG
jgi:hypothetical protein